MKKRKIVFIFLLIVVIVAALKILIPKAATEIKKENVITSSQLKNAINISQLSTAEFVYNGIAEKYADESTEEVECYIAYDANVKVGIQMEDVAFNIDEECTSQQKLDTNFKYYFSINLISVQYGASFATFLSG